MKHLLGGLVVPLVTPMARPGVPSAEAAAPLLRAMAAAGVRRLMLLGSNGEGPLVRADRIPGYVAAIAERWRDLVDNPVVLVNVTAAGTDEVRRRAEDVSGRGADALVLSPPTYFRHRADEVVAHYAALAGHGLPVVAYNAPRYATPLTAASIDGLVTLPHVVGVKDSSGDPALLNHLIAAAGRRPDFTVSQGDERGLAAALRAGAGGIVPGTANLAPGLAVGMVAAREAGDLAELDRLQELTTDLTHLHQIRPGVPAVKALLHRWELCPPYVAPPLTPCTPQETRALADAVRLLRPHLLDPTA
ncbi:dihydrodipicolinate synthase family protein [Dactylosporangium sp. AC04546]|uniref:dihydrodipicolinate synthase family protein n=1 Tax=Dactylosporangium sp. AC04546 TaxID=2862460 RepID=UPI001EE06464|nr:dihydrodipicolinate synthase family protein [Dactylosporangium sp. AC04546]WVK81130.1 dihydrodipicolinate synthase family protein [Dactylosporangium sp. AC04546]